MFAGSVFRHKQDENQGNGFAVGRIKGNRLFGADKAPVAFFTHA